MERRREHREREACEPSAVDSRVELSLQHLVEQTVLKRPPILSISQFIRQSNHISFPLFKHQAAGQDRSGTNSSSQPQRTKVSKAALHDPDSPSKRLYILDR